MKLFSLLIFNILLFVVSFTGSQSFAEKVKQDEFRVISVSVNSYGSGREYSFIVVDRETNIDYNVRIYAEGQTWAGSNVTELNRDHYSDIGRQYPMGFPVDKEIERKVLVGLYSDIKEIIADSSKYNQATDFNIIHPDIPETTSPKDSFLPNNGFSGTGHMDASQSFNHIFGGGDRLGTSPMGLYNAEKFQIEMQKGLQDRLSKFEGGLKEHEAQQQAQRAATDQQTNLVMGNLEENLKALAVNNAQKKAQLLGILAASFSVPTAKHPSQKKNQLESINLVNNGKEVLEKRVQESLQAKKWQKLADDASLLFNPWSGLTSNYNIKQLDQQGIIKGPAFKENTLNISSLKVKDPKLAYKIRTSANQIQALVKQKPYYMQMQQSQRILQSASLLLRVAIDSESHELADKAQNLISHYSGAQVEQNYVIGQSGENVSFHKSGEYGLLSSQNPQLGGLSAKASYNEIVKNLNWLKRNPGLVSTVQRSYGEAINVKQTIHNLASSTINDSEEWIKEARQNYKVNHGSQSFTNSKVSNQLKEIESIKEGYFPDSQEIIDSSKIALSLADEAYKNKNNITGDFWLKSAAQLADLAIGFIPIASVFDDLHSVIVGKSLFERRELSTEERAIAAVGVVTLGLGSEIVKASAVLEIAGKAIVAYGAKKGVDLVFKHGKKVIAAAIKYGFDSSKDLGHYARTMRYANVKNFDGFLAQTARNKLGKPIVFTSNKAIEHFQKHGPDIMSSMYKNSYNLKDYVLDAQHVIKEGQYVKEANAYIQLIGGGGKNSLAKKQTKDGVSKYAFVGVDKEHTRITTFHIKSVKELKKKYPLLGIE